MSSQTLLKAKAKTNLFLQVVGKKENGYHLIESCFAFADSIFDVIEIRPADLLSVKFIGAQINPIDNTVYKAAKLVGNHFQRNTNYEITITKNIPIAAGLGGGSADAAAIIRYFCNLWNVEINSEVYNLALQVGADVPACLYNKACFVAGIGEKIKPIKSVVNIPIVIVNHGSEVSTQHIFKQFNSKFRDNIDQINEQDAILPIVKNTTNSLQEVAVSLFPKIQEVVSQIITERGCITSRMSGSGPSCFGIFDSIENANKAAINLRKKYLFVQATTLN